MGKKTELGDHKETAKVEAVLELLRKQTPLTVKQEKFCNYACVKRFLKAKGDSVKKASKQLKACLAWRESVITDHLIADDFSAELADGLAYVAGHDDESRPVMIFRLKQDYQKLHSQKMFTRLLAFTMEVAISTMPKNVEQFVMLFDARPEGHTESVRSAPGVSKTLGSKCRPVRKGIIGNWSFYRSASAFMNQLLPALKIVAEYYPGRLCKAFVIDPPSLFAYLWKGVRPFVELSSWTTVVSSLDFEESFDFNDFAAYPRASSLRFDASTVKSTAKIGSCSSSRFSFTVSHHLDSLKPCIQSGTYESLARADLAAKRALALVRLARREDPPRPPGYQERPLPLHPAAAESDGAAEDLVPAVAGDVFPSREPREREGREVPRIVLALCKVLSKTVRRNGLQVEDAAPTRWPDLHCFPSHKKTSRFRFSAIIIFECINYYYYQHQVDIDSIFDPEFQLSSSLVREQSTPGVTNQAGYETACIIYVNFWRVVLEIAWEEGSVVETANSEVQRSVGNSSGNGMNGKALKMRREEVKTWLEGVSEVPFPGVAHEWCLSDGAKQNAAFNACSYTLAAAAVASVASSFLPSTLFYKPPILT
ncbi:hypothetical protein V8G54_030054 [Vigna mungo]|uniref:CRAL-TRIO domain-containing protein n=1 Tax=Vigna mungo TaxID=3915 RepID=A0AAQ3RMG4_VIGMU